MINDEDREYIDVLRGFSILRVMLGHLGLFWFYPPYSWYIGAFFPILFFVSGAVSYNSYRKSGSVWVYLVKRYLSIAVPFYLFIALLALISIISSTNFSTSLSLMRWLFMWPEWGGIEIPIGQIWFINALLIISLFSSVAFPVFHQRPLCLPVFIGGSLIAIIASGHFELRDRFVEDLSSVFGIYSSQMWAIVNLSVFYFLGAFYYSAEISDLRGATLISTMLAGIMIVVMIVVWHVEADFQSHAIKRSPFYVCVSLFALFAVLAMKPLYFLLKDYIRPIRWILSYSSKHSYAIFLWHTVVLFAVEKTLNMENLSDNLGLAIVRLVLVSAITLAIAPLFTRCTKQLIELVKRTLLG